MSTFAPELTGTMQEWLKAHQYARPSFIAKGKSGAVWKVEKNGKSFAIKIEHEKSTRNRMMEKETQLLRMVNQLNVGPKVEEVDLGAGIIVMQYLDGIPLANWIEQTESRVKMERGLSRLFGQVKKLDRAGIDHGQLGGKLHNVFMDANDQPTILDFEKASYVRGTHNVSKLKEVLLGGRTPFSKKILQVWPSAKDELNL